MDITQQPSTIGEMSPEHFEAYIVAIIKHATDGRFDKIESDIGQLKNDVHELKTDVRGFKSDVRQLKSNNVRTDDTLEEIKNMFYMNQTRFDHMERDIIRHDRQLEKVAL